MRRIVGLTALKPSIFKRPVVTIGVFDGMHRGHRHVIEHLRAMADRLDGDAVVLTFDTHPRAVLAGGSPRRILSVPHRLLLLDRHGVDTTVLLPFDDAMRDMPYDVFTRKILVERIGIRGILFGYNTRFGHRGEGTFERIQPLGTELGFEVSQAPPIGLDGRPISASRIRDTIQAGNIVEAQAMLGRPVAIYGMVVRGDGRGRTLGFPTANVEPEGEVLPPRGVYQVVATIRSERYAAVANLGLRPTFGADHLPDEYLLEVHVPGLDTDLYGRRVEIEFVRKIRDERRFPDKEALIRQIQADVDSLGSA